MIGSLLYLAALAAVSPSAVPTDPPKDGVEVITRMRERYLGKWYRTVTFVQKTTLADGKVETWYEAAELPGKLRIDIAPLEGRNTLLFRNDTLYEFKEGKLTEAEPLIHPLMVLGFDVYAQPLDRTLGQLRELGFDLAKVHEAEWQGRPAYVVGAEAGATVFRADAGARQEGPHREGRDPVQQVRPHGPGLAGDRGQVHGERRDQDAGGVHGAQGEREARSRDLRPEPLGRTGLGALTVSQVACKAGHCYIGPASPLQTVSSARPP
jgi:hypothetical protein